MREVHVDQIRDTVSRLCQEASCYEPTLANGEIEAIRGAADATKELIKLIELK